MLSLQDLAFARIETIHKIRHTERDSAKYPNHTNLKYKQINNPKANQNNLTWRIRFVVFREDSTFCESKK